MSFTENQQSFSKMLITLVIIQLDYCANQFGLSPCKATGAACFNTYRTCKDKTHFKLTIKQYRFINNDAPDGAAALLNAMPVITAFEPMSTEVSDSKTIPARGTVTFADEPDYDQTADPYWKNRRNDLLDTKGFFFKKLLERNPYYKGRTIIVKEGYYPDSESEFIERFNGKIENITRDKNTVKIEFLDELADLSKIEYPYKSNSKITNDIGEVFIANSDNELAKLTAQNGDYAIRKDFVNINVNVSYDNNYASTLIGDLYYVLIALDDYNNAIARADIQANISNYGKEVILTWSYPEHYSLLMIAKYRIYTLRNNLYAELPLSSTTFIDRGQFLNNLGAPENEAYRLYQINNYIWLPVYSQPYITLNIDDDNLSSTGYIQIDDEVIYYGQKNNKTLTNLKFKQFNTASQHHYAGTNIKLIDWEEPQNPFILLKNRLIRSGIGLAKIDTTIDNYAIDYSGINMSIKPLIKTTTADKLIFDLAYVLDIKLWVNEEGKITIKDNADDTIQYYVNDADNIILDSKSIDFNQDDIKTRINLYWDRNDVTKSITDINNYTHLNTEIFLEAESSVIYNRQIKEDNTTVWLNMDCAFETYIISYIHTILNKKLSRKIYPRPKLSFDVELKDSNIKVGDIIALSSDIFNDLNGNNYQNQKAEIIKKNPKGGKITLQVRLLVIENITTETETHINIYKNPLPIFTSLNNLYEVTGLSYIDATGNRNCKLPLENIDGNYIQYLDLETEITLAFDNMFVSEQQTAIDINGIVRSLPKIFIKSGFPPEPHGIIIDTSSWRTNKTYYVYLIIFNDGYYYSNLGHPSNDDPAGKWYQIAKIIDEQNTDINKVYSFNYKLPLEFIGKRIGFAIYCDAQLKFDANAENIIVGPPILI